MSNSNYVPNSSNTTQQYEALGPDGTKVTQPPQTVAPDVKPRKRQLGSPYFREWVYVPIIPKPPDSNSNSTQNAKFLMGPSMEYLTGDPTLNEDTRPKHPQPGNPLMRHLIRYQIWQDPMLHAQTTKLDTSN